MTLYGIIIIMLFRFSYHSPDGSVVRFRARILPTTDNNNTHASDDTDDTDDTEQDMTPLVRKHTRFGRRGNKTTTFEEVQPIPVSCQRTGWCQLPRQTL
jgi:hypothetical protein